MGFNSVLKGLNIIQEVEDSAFGRRVALLEFK
jgi:hypothetical protein